jgi:hypothetical protein
MVEEVQEGQLKPSKLVISFPAPTEEAQFQVVPTTTIQDIRQHIYDTHKYQFFTCFYLAFHGKRVGELQEVLVSFIDYF